MLNRIIERQVIGQPIPKVGMGATKILWSDRHAGTIVSVSKSGKSLTWKRDNSERIDGRGMSDTQEYKYTPNDLARPQVFTLRKNGQWVAKSHPLRHGTKLRIGERQEYYDFSY